MNQIILSAVIFYVLSLVSYLVIRSSAVRLARRKLRSRSEKAIWVRDYSYMLNWAFLPVLLLPGIALLIYFLIFDSIAGVEVLMYGLLFIFFAMFVNKGIENFLDLKEQVRNLSDKPDYIRNTSISNSERTFEVN